MIRVSGATGRHFQVALREITVEFDDAALLWAGFRLTDFVPAADVGVRGLQNRYRIAGIGAPLVATVEPIEGVTTKLSARVPPRLKIPATAFLRLDDPRGALKSGKLKSKLEFCPRCVLPFDRLPQHERLVRWHFI